MVIQAEDEEQRTFILAELQAIKRLLILQLYTSGITVKQIADALEENRRDIARIVGER